jgi:hypothetical protein
MKKQILFLLIGIISIATYSQISFENGYYINNANQKIECQIKNMDWRNNPNEFDYRLSENSESLKADINYVKEFEIYNVSKYIRAKVGIDRSSNNISDLSDDKKPIFNEEELFLKILVDGHANLYQYLESNLERYFYNVGESNIEQLVHKTYQFSNTEVGINNHFKQQLLNDLKCSSLTMNDVERLDYKKTRLTNFFIKYHNCKGIGFHNYSEQKSSDWFVLTLRPRLTSQALMIKNPQSSAKGADFGSKLGVGLGFEMEFILPFNKSKWSLLVEPTYQSFSADYKRNAANIFEQALVSEVNYKSIEIPFGLRHYFFLNENSKLFINVAYVLDLPMDSSIEFRRDDGSILSDLSIDAHNNYAIGVGYKFNNRYSMELRYLTNRKILGNYLYWSSEYKTTSFIFGYTVF